MAEDNVAADLDAWWKFPVRVGWLLAAPRAALLWLNERGGGIRDAMILTLVGVVAFRFQQLAEAVMALGQPSQGSIGHLLGVWANELNEAATVVIPVAILLTLLAGRFRDPAQDLELACACYTPFFVVRGMARAVNALAGERVLPDLVGYIPAALATLWLVVHALLVIRTRTPAPPESGEAVTSEAALAPMLLSPSPPSISSSTSRPRLVGAMALVATVVGIGLAGNAVWAVRRLDTLKPMQRGLAAPDFQLPRIDSVAGTIALSSLRGKVVVLDFWATWCPPCIQMIPVMDRLHHEWNGRGVEFLGVNSDGGQTSEAEIRAFVRQHPAPYPMVLDDGRANAAYRIRALPQFVLIARDGTIVRTFLGLTSREEFASVLEKALSLP